MTFLLCFNEWSIGKRDFIQHRNPVRNYTNDTMSHYLVLRKYQLDKTNLSLDPKCCQSMGTGSKYINSYEENKVPPEKRPELRGNFVHCLAI